MMTSLKYFLIGKQFIGVEHYSIDGQTKKASLSIKKTSDELSINSKGEMEEDFALSQNKIPHFITISTDQIIQKEVQGNEASDEKLLFKAFPNISSTDFYYEIWRLDSVSIIAIGRKIYIEEILAKYQERKVPVIGFSLGVCALEGIIKHAQTDRLETNQHYVSINTSADTFGIRKSFIIIPFLINGLEILNTHLLAFSGVVSLFTPGYLRSGNIQSDNNKLIDKYIQDKLFHKLSITILSFTAIFLLVNFMLFMFYFQKNRQSEFLIEKSKSKSEAINSVAQRVAKKEEMFSSMSGINSSNISNKINEIARITPHSITFNEMIFHPLKQKIQATEPIAIVDKTLVVSGTSINNIHFTEWIEAIESKPFVQNVVIMNFEKEETSKNKFTVKINLK